MSATSAATDWVVLAMGDGALGFWGALRKVFPQAREQHCCFQIRGKYWQGPGSTCRAGSWREAERRALLVADERGARLSLRLYR